MESPLASHRRSKPSSKARAHRHFIPKRLRPDLVSSVDRHPPLRDGRFTDRLMVRARDLLTTPLLATLRDSDAKLADRDLDRAFAPHDDVLWREFDDGAVLLHLGTRLFFGLNAVGTVIWTELARGRTPSRAIAAVRRKFDVDLPTARSDALRLVARMRAEQLLVPRSGKAPSTKKMAGRGPRAR